MRRPLQAQKACRGEHGRSATAIHFISAVLLEVSKPLEPFHRLGIHFGDDELESGHYGLMKSIQFLYEFLHDLKEDPDQLKNLAGDAKHGEVLKQMRARCDELRGEYRRGSAK